MLQQTGKADSKTLAISPDSSPGDPSLLSLGTPPAGDLPFPYKSIFWTISLLLALVTAMDSRFQVSGDGISYIEMGDAYYRGDWKMAVNSYWSPLYSWLIVFPKHLFGLSLYHESTAVHLVNFLIFVFVLCAFEFFLGGLISALSLSDQDASGCLPPWALRLIAYSLFVYSTLYWLSTDIVSPDLAVEGIVLLVAGLTLRIHFEAARSANFARLGLVLGIGYLTKAVLFPLSFIFLLAAFFAVPMFRQSFLKVSLAAVLFLLVSSPYIFLLSQAKGRLTYGDTGRINYAMYVDNAPLAVHWQGEDPRYGTPVHATRRLLDHPAVFEFAEPIRGSYPPWYDPAYWYEGITPKFNLGRELYRLHGHSHQFLDLFEAQSEFIAGFLALYLIAPGFKTFLHRWFRLAWLWAPALVALGAYSLIHVETRFLPGFLLILWLSVFAALPAPDSVITRKVVWCVSLALVLTVAFRVGKTFFYEVGHLADPRPFLNWQVAEQLRSFGVRPGDRVASIGFTFDGYWAHLARVTIVAEVPEGDAGAFWIADPETKAKVFQLFTQAGAKAVVSNRIQTHTFPGDWIRITGWTPAGRSTYWVKPLSDASAKSQ